MPPTPRYRLATGDVERVLSAWPEETFQAALCDPPYGLQLTGLWWDEDLPEASVWSAVARVLEPGAWVLAFGHPRTHHRLMATMEGGGLEVRDVLLWLFGTGLAKGRTTLKPAWQPIVLARRPGPPRALAIEASRTRGVVLSSDRRSSPRGRRTFTGELGKRRTGPRHHPAGRWPSNLLLDHVPGCTEDACAPGCPVSILGGESGIPRFFWCPKPAGAEIRGNPHRTKKPVRLTEYLARLLRLEGDRRIVVPFAGSGSEMVGAVRAEWPSVCGVEIDPAWRPIAERRLHQSGARPDRRSSPG